MEFYHGKLVKNMGKGTVKENNNVYFRARKSAAMYNEKLFSRENTSELLGVSASTLSDYELGNTKVIPADIVVKMSELYNAPELKRHYCKECVIGREMPIATDAKGLEGIALRMLLKFDADEIKSMKNSLIQISADGVISDDEKPELIKILRKLDDMSIVISEMKIVGEKMLKR